MAIPALDSNGFLPAGVHDCTVEEIETRFGSFQDTDRRPRLWARFKELIREAAGCGLVEAILLDGSFVTAKPNPNDIDVIIVVSAKHDFTADLIPAAYNVLSKRRVRRKYGFDLLVASADSDQYRRYVHFFQQIRFEPEQSKGILRVKL